MSIVVGTTSASAAALGRSSSPAVTPVATETAKLSPWIVRVVRVGFAAKGLVYLVIGTLALRAALGAGGSTTDTRGALQAILRQPFGRVLLLATALGLAAYAAWRVVQAILNPERVPPGPRGLGTRLARFGSGVVYGSLAFAAVRMLIGFGRAMAEGREVRDWTRRAMMQPMGRWLVAAAGAGVIAYGLYQLFRAARGSFRRKLVFDGAGAKATASSWMVRAGRIGIAARGFVFLLIGGFLLVAAMRIDPDEAKGLGGALAALARAPYGPLWLGTVAMGLVAYGLFQLVEARYRVIRPPDFRGLGQTP